MSKSNSRINLIDRLSQKLERDENAANTSRRPPPASLVERAVASESNAEVPSEAAPDLGLSDIDELDLVETKTPHDASWKASESHGFVELNLQEMARLGYVTPEGERSKTKEQFRAIKRPLLINAFQRRDHHSKPHVIMVTSAFPGEGKTFTATNLAMSIAAEREIKVLLMEGDVLRQDLSKHFGIENNKGYLDLLRGEDLSISDILVRTNVPSLGLLPSGQYSDDATELFASPRMMDMVDDLASRYNDRIIIVDTPPVLASSETQTLATHAGQIVMVVEAGQTPRQRIEEALALISNCERTYCVLNKADEADLDDRYGNYPDYYGTNG